MAQALEGIKNGEGMIKVGSTGTIGSLMMREFDQISDVPNNQQVPSLSKPETVSASVTAQKQPQQRKSSDQASSSSSSSIINHRSSGIAPKTKPTNGRHHQRIPMLGSDSFPVERSPIRKKNEKKKSNIVEIVDIKCGHPDKAWSTPITNSLKKLGFSKLSESIS